MDINRNPNPEGDKDGHPQKPLRACGYYYSASENQAEPISIALRRQKESVSDYCRGERLPLVAEYADTGASRASIDRPQLNKMLEIACSKDRPFDVIVVEDLSRISGDLKVVGSMFDQLAANGVQLISVRDDDRLMSKIMCWRVIEAYKTF